jgi:hypothetical protein
MPLNYYGFELNVQGDPPPTGPREQAVFTGLIDRILNIESDISEMSRVLATSNITDFAVWAAAITDNVSLIVDVHTSIGSTVVLPNNVDIIGFYNGARFTGSGVLTINRMSCIPTQRVFDSSLTVRLMGFNVVQVRWFGNDAQALQSAIDAPYPVGHYDNGDIYSCAIDFGDENVNIGDEDVILRRNGVTLRGMSRLFSEIRMRNGSLVIPSNVSNITIEGLLLYNTNNVDGRTIDIQGVAPNGPRRIAIKENEFRGGKYKVRMGHCYSSKILDNYFYSSVSYDTYGVYIDDSVTQSITIRGNQFQDSRVYVDGYYGINMEENYFEGSVGPLVDIVRNVGYTHHGNRYECDAAGILGLNIRQECAGGSVKGNTFHGSGNASPCVLCDGAQHEFGGNYFLRASGGVNPVSLTVNSRFNKFNANYYTATGQQPPISDSGYRNTAFKQGLKSIVRYAQELIIGGDAIKRYENDDRVYIEMPDSVDSYISVLFPLPVDISDGVDGKYTVTLKIHYSAANAPGQTLTFAFGYKLLGVGEFPFNSQSEFSGAVLSSLSNLLQVASYEITQLYPLYWDDLQVKGLSTMVRPVVNNGLWYAATVAGTTGTTEPAWPTTAGSTVVDGSVTWTAIPPLDDFLRVRIRRNPADANDTFTQTVKILAVEMEYNSIDFYPTGRN